MQRWFYCDSNAIRSWYQKNPKIIKKIKSYSKLIPKLFKSDSTLSLKVISNWTQSECWNLKEISKCFQVITKRFQRNSKVIPNWFVIDFKNFKIDSKMMIHNWFKPDLNDAKMIPMWFKCDTKLIPKCLKSDSTLSFKVISN